VNVHSPKNDEIYPSNTVQLSFTPIRVDDMNFTSFTYVLDGQSPVAINGTATLTNLPPGQHILTIYCSYNIHYFSRTYEFLNRTYEYKDQIANVVYFTTQYSIPWITFTIITVSAATIIPSMLFFKRRQIKARLMLKKTGVFWLGTFLLVSGSLALVPFAWKITMDSLFPYWPRGVAVSLSFYWCVNLHCRCRFGHDVDWHSLWKKSRQSKRRKKISFWVNPYRQTFSFLSAKK
jgi:hypothetical protein